MIDIYRLVNEKTGAICAFVLCGANSSVRVCLNQRLIRGLQEPMAAEDERRDLTSVFCLFPETREEMFGAKAAAKLLSSCHQCLARSESGSWENQ